VKIPYSDLRVKPDAAFPNRTSLDRPIVALLLNRGERNVIAYATVDSGADNCVFPASIGIALGVDIPNPRSSLFSGSRDERQIAYYEEIQATILPMESAEIGADQEPISFPLYAGFCETLEHVGMGLLGQEGFFSRFAVNFFHAQSYFEIL
jgi:hypothetical protein